MTGLGCVLCQCKPHREMHGALLRGALLQVTQDTTDDGVEMEIKEQTLGPIGES